MMQEDIKCVLVMDETLPTGVLVNAAAILGVSLGAFFPQIIGPDVPDGDGRVHRGIVTKPVPVLRASAEILTTLWEKLKLPAYEQIMAVDFSNIAQGCHVYEEYMAAAKATTEFSYLGLLLCGGKQAVNKLTGSLPLLR